jgi:hypothetical protein
LWVATARERAVSFLHEQLEWVALFREDYGGEAWPERDGRVAGSLGALRAVGLLAPEEAEAWRARLSASGEERPTAPRTARQAGGGLLEELFDEVAPDDDPPVALSRFQGALEALRAVGAADAEWDERLRRRMGWPSAAEARELNAGGTQEELLAVLAGPAEAVDGVRVPYALRFSDGICFVIRREGDLDEEDDGWSEAELVDDAGTSYWAAGGGGSGEEQRLSFHTAPPSHARWVELRGVASEPIRVAL